MSSSVPPEPAHGARQKLTSLGMAPVVSAVAFVLAWQILLMIVSTTALPTPLEVAGFMVDELRGDTLAPYTIYEAFGLSLMRLATGLVAAGLVGVVAGVLIGQSRLVSAFAYDFVLGTLMAPHLVFALLFAMWFGFGFFTPVWTVFLAAVPFVIINVAEGVRNVPKDLVDMSRAFGVGHGRVLREVVVPSLVPYLFAAGRYSVALGWKAIVLAEIWGASDGAGWVFRYWYDAHRVRALVGYALLFVVLVLALDQLVFRRLNDRATRWQQKDMKSSVGGGRPPAAVKAEPTPV